MTRLPIPDEARERLNDGRTVELQHPDLGSPGHNGTIVLEPEPYDDQYTIEPDIEVIDGE